MTQPDYVPLRPSDRIRPSERLTVPGPWRPDRPADLTGGVSPTESLFGSPGPDLGYGLKLAHRFANRLQLAPDESTEDVIVACFACAAKRASSFGRAPVVYDLEWAYTLWGALGDAPRELVNFRRRLLRGAAEDYWDQRAVVDRVRPEVLRLTAAEVRTRLGDWQSLLVTERAGSDPLA